VARGANACSNGASVATKRFVLLAGAVCAAALTAAPVASATPKVRSQAGTTGSLLTQHVDAFRDDLGAVNPNTAGSFAGGRREINWDGVPDGLARPASLPGDFFNVNSPRGVLMTTPGTGLAVSQDSNSPADADPDLIEFGDVNGNYGTVDFNAFSAQRLFAPIASNVVDVAFRVPGSDSPATTNGFGAVFTDVDFADGASIEYFDQSGASLGIWYAPRAQADGGGLSFVGVSFSGPERVSRVRITSGTAALGANDFTEGGAADMVALDDFIYGEPEPSVEFSAAAYSVDESAGQATITVRRPAGAEAVTVGYSTSDGTAWAGSDYTATAGTLDFAAGATERTFTVPVTADAELESTETVTLALSAPVGVGGLGATRTATLSIVDSTPRPQPTTPAVDKLAVTVDGLPSSVRYRQFLRGLRFGVTPSRAASFDLALLATTKRASAARFNLAIAESTVRQGTGRRVVRLKPSRRLLGARRKLTLRLRIVATGADGQVTVVARTVRVRP
jgi:hypothetical protein